MGPRDERIARNEGWLRSANERIERASRDFAERGFAREREEVEFFCECGRDVCHERITLTVAEYEDAHSLPDRFVVLLGHASPDIEQVVRREPGYLVVEKGAAAEDAADRA